MTEPQDAQEMENNVKEAASFINSQLSSNHGINVNARAPEKGSIWLNVSTHTQYRIRNGKEDKEMPIKHLETIGPILDLKIRIGKKNKVSIIAKEMYKGHEAWTVLSHDWYYIFQEFMIRNIKGVFATKTGLGNQH